VENESNRPGITAVSGKHSLVQESNLTRCLWVHVKTIFFHFIVFLVCLFVVSARTGHLYDFTYIQYCQSENIRLVCRCGHIWPVQTRHARYKTLCN
jgi:hypothetical protein